MVVLKTREELRRWVKLNQNRERVLVPTMGALHRGHTSLFDEGVKAAGGEGDVLATIFVNPTQFGPNEDFDAYPRHFEEDLEKCENHGVTAVFAPSSAEMYEENASISVTESSLSKHLCGASRPGHFDGVCLVVSKLFLLTQPDAAVFGEKDFQQLAIIRRLVRDLNFPIKIISGKTVREKDGLALSSRNAYLSDKDRAEAPVIHAALKAAANSIGDGSLTSPEEVITQLSTQINRASGAEIDYLAVVDADTLEAVASFGQNPIRILAAVHFGKTRLIDNIGVIGAD
ncbi:MAG: pantoate--beta-alanine ligase [Verrucomicrobiales bacterium]|nr:pantoate--beta-alanine ligase [Verrucomicrobiales bacterium]